MTARYLVRFDDICPTMDWRMWDRVAALLDRHGIRPIMAVVPDNRDPKLQVAPARDDFWAQVRDWQARGWFIAMHGYQHLYVTQDPGLPGINPFSEFAGLAYRSQKSKLEAALRIMRDEGVRAEGWVAPAHSFDTATVRALLELGIDVISDGFYSRPVRHLGATWVPQQLWRFRRVPAGLWTVCLHANTLDESSFAALATDFARFSPRITSMHAVLGQSPREIGPLDRAMMHAWRATLRMKQRYRAGLD